MVLSRKVWWLLLWGLFFLWAPTALAQEPRVPYQQALELYDQGAFSEALELLEVMAADFSQNPAQAPLNLQDFYYNLGNVYYKKSSYGWALASYLEAAAYGSSEDLWFNIHHIYKLLDLEMPSWLAVELSTASSFYEQLISTHPPLQWLWKAVMVSFFMVILGWLVFRYFALWGVVLWVLGALLSAFMVVFSWQGPSLELRRGEYYGVVGEESLSLYSTSGVSRVELFKLPPYTLVRLVDVPPEVLMATSSSSESSQAIKVAFRPTVSEGDVVRGWVEKTGIMSWKWLPEL